MKQAVMVMMVFAGIGCGVDPAPSDEPEVEPATATQSDALGGVKPNYFQCVAPETCSCPYGAALAAPQAGARCSATKVCC